MNQSVLFSDMKTWDEQRQSIFFTAQQGGALIDCWINKAGLEALSQKPVLDGPQAIQRFEECRFDIEDLAQEQIEDEAYNEAGEIEVIISLA